jgi:hypothetical protein
MMFSYECVKSGLNVYGLAVNIVRGVVVVIEGLSPGHLTAPRRLMMMMTMMMMMMIDDDDDIDLVWCLAWAVSRKARSRTP